jgi:hypothetical protein
LPVPFLWPQDFAEGPQVHGHPAAVLTQKLKKKAEEEEEEAGDDLSTP